MRVAITGGRDHRDRALVFRTLDALPVTVLIHGWCPTGVDQFADDWGTLNDIPMERYKPLWATYGRAAGVMRNARMLEDGRPHIVVGFKGGVGTNDMIHRARKAGVEIMMVGWD